MSEQSSLFSVDDALLLHEPIDSFQGEYRFLSNFFPAKVVLNNRCFPTVEHAYVAAKCLFPEDVETILYIDVGQPGKAKRLGRKLEQQHRTREDWHDIKVSIMRMLIEQKFTDTNALGKKLLETGERLLIEGNNHGDTFWGMCHGKGKNWLGVLLMERRTQLQLALVSNKM